MYRRYLDYGALDGLREMKAAIAAEVARKELADDIKRGPGGIREIEFLVQALQLIRGGREPALRERRLLPALRGAGRCRPRRRRRPATAMREAYRFLRRLENRLQMLRDAQTHALPERCAGSRADRARAGSRRLGRRCATRWTCIARASPPNSKRCWRRAGATPSAMRSPATGARCPMPATRRRWPMPVSSTPPAPMPACATSPARRRCVRCPMPRARGWIACCRRCSTPPRASPQPDAALRRLLPLLHNILRRASYLALLDEQPAALQRLVDVVARSALLAERLAAYPLLLDELLDVRVAGPLPDARRDDRAPATARWRSTTPKPRCRR